MIIPRFAIRRIRPSGRVKPILPRHEIVVVDVAGGRKKTTPYPQPHVDQEDAVLVDQEEVAIGLEKAVDDRRTEAASNPIERDRITARFDETRRLAFPDVEGLPIDDRFVCGLINADLVSALARDSGVSAVTFEPDGSQKQGEAKRKSVPTSASGAARWTLGDSSFLKQPAAGDIRFDSRLNGFSRKRVWWSLAAAGDASGPRPR